MFSAHFFLGKPKNAIQCDSASLRVGNVSCHYGCPLIVAIPCRASREMPKSIKLWRTIEWMTSSSQENTELWFLNDFHFAVYKFKLFIQTGQLKVNHTVLNSKIFILTCQRNHTVFNSKIFILTGQRNHIAFNFKIFIPTGQRKGMDSGNPYNVLYMQGANNKTRDHKWSWRSPWSQFWSFISYTMYFLFFIMNLK